MVAMRPKQAAGSEEDLAVQAVAQIRTIDVATIVEQPVVAVAEENFRVPVD